MVNINSLFLMQSFCNIKGKAIALVKYKK